MWIPDREAPGVPHEHVTDSDNVWRALRALHASFSEFLLMRLKFRGTISVKRSDNI